MRTSRHRLRARTWLLFAVALVLLGILATQVLADYGTPTSGVSGHGRHKAANSQRRTVMPPMPGQPGPAPALRSVLVHAAIEPWAVRARLPRSFLGLSMEYWDLPALDSNPGALRRVLALLHVSGNGPVMLRIGGDSADQTFWGYARLARRQPWPYSITQRWLLKLRRLVRSAHVRVILDLNLAVRSPSMAARFARAAEHALPAHAIAALEIGNEPDILHHWVDYHRRGHAAVMRPWPRSWDHFSPSGYAREFRAYAAALSRAVPGIPLAGPALAHPYRDLGWLGTLLSRDRLSLRLLTVHRYPLTACARPASGDFATITRVLSPGIASGLAPSLAGAVRAGQTAGLPVRLTELNSVSCEGRRGVSDTFASALWAPDALFSMWSAGLAGVNIHVREGALNAAFMMTHRAVLARPLLYGLLLFQRALGPEAALVRLRVTRAPLGLRVWAVRTRGRIKVLVVNKGAQPVRLGLRAPARRWGTVQRLSAPAIRATAGITLDGQSLGPRGRWVGRRRVPRLGRSANGRYMLAVPPYSAALVTLRQ